MFSNKAKTKISTTTCHERNGSEFVAPGFVFSKMVKGITHVKTKACR